MSVKKGTTMRVNKTAIGYLLPMTNNLTKDMKRMSGVCKLGKGNYAIPRASDVALPLTHNNLKNRTPYKLGDGDYSHAPQRPGSDHSSIKSRGHQC